ncbi:MAG: CoA-binding protein [Spirochaetes bacterium]|jgi:predicted CoA-binding protein|nr:CoA-binding protein [Spirochaetota bacterium]
MKKVILLGANSKEDGYAYTAFGLLQQKGFEVLPVHPSNKSIDGVPVLKSIERLTDIYAVSAYVNGTILEGYCDDIIKVSPQRVVMNPGSESEKAEKFLTEAGIEVIRGCSIVLLKTDRF